MQAMGLSLEKNGPTLRRRLWPSCANDSISRPVGRSSDNPCARAKILLAYLANVVFSSISPVRDP